VVVVQGTGGVSLFALQLAKLLGARVILISSSEQKLELGRKLGADCLVNYRVDPAWDVRVMEMTDGRGADLIVEIGGAETLQRSLNAAAFGGGVAIIGVRSGFGVSPPFPIEQVLMRNLTLHGMTVGSRRELEGLCAAVEAHGLQPVIDQTFAFDEAQAAMALMQSGGHVGKIGVQIV
jgi:NADPH:quinone reductase-like Zn-dependent oxidoreductase